MLERLIIEGFQCHELLEVELDPLVTVLVGRTDSGKSAVLRALRWVCTNRPAGEQFRRRGADTCSAALLLDEGRSVRRVKGREGNRYYRDAQLYTAFGSDVPADVLDLLNIGPDNFQGQHDAPYWLSLSPGEASRELNRVVNLDLIDRALADVGAEARKAKATVEVSRDRLKEARTRRDSLAWVVEANRDWTGIESLQAEATQAAKTRARIASLYETGVEAYQTLQNATQVSLALGNGILRLQSLYDAVVEARKRVETITDLINKVRIAEEDLCRKTRSADVAGKELKKASGSRCPLCGSPWRSSVPTST